MTDKTKKAGGDTEMSPLEQEQRLLETERRSWLLWTFGIAGAIVVIIVTGTIAINPWPDPEMTGSTPRAPQVETPAP